MAEQSIGALAQKVIGPWAWWRAALKNPAAIGKTLSVHEGEPQQGYFRVRYGKDKPYEPVAIWRDEETGNWLAYRSGREVRAEDIWTSVCRNPVSYEAYVNASDGKGWPDDDKVVAAQVAPPAPTIGDNSGDVDEASTLMDQIEAALAGMDAYKTISDDATAAKALSLRNRLNELSRDADKIRTKEKEPFLEAGKAVDAKWQPLVKKAKAGADQVRDCIGAWETKKLQAERKRQYEAEQARIASEKAIREQQGEMAVIDAPQAESVPDAATGQIKATYGKAASVSVKVFLKEVTDYGALYQYMSGREEVHLVLRQLAQRALDAGRTNIPGITVEERANVR